jgi:hypothetical protein
MDSGRKENEQIVGAATVLDESIDDDRQQHVSGCSSRLIGHNETDGFTGFDNIEDCAAVLVRPDGPHERGKNVALAQRRERSRGHYRAKAQ